MNTQRNLPPKKKFKIGDIADVLDIKKFVIRSWEKEFALDKGGNGLYSEQDITIFKQIKDLLILKKLTIEETKKLLLLDNKSNTIERNNSEESKKKEAAVLPALHSNNIDMTSETILTTTDSLSTNATNENNIEINTNEVSYVAAAPLYEEQEKKQLDFISTKEEIPLAAEHENKKTACSGVDCKKTYLIEKKLEKLKLELIEIKNMLES